MHFVILRDDDTNALTPPACLERLYRPFLDRAMPVNLAVIPEVRANLTLPDGRREGFLPNDDASAADTLPIGMNIELVAYLRANPGFRVVQHGCHHDYLEFEASDRAEVSRRLDRGQQRLREASLGRPSTFVAPYDRISSVSLEEITRRFQIVSTGWFELQRVPRTWWPRYAWKKLRGHAHWRVNRSYLLSHPGCLLSCHHPYEAMLATIRAAISSHTVTVLVTHWWEYFRDGKPDDAFIDVLHQTAAMLSHRPDVKVISFEDLPALGNGVLS